MCFSTIVLWAAERLSFLLDVYQVDARVNKRDITQLKRNDDGREQGEIPSFREVYNREGV